MQSNYLNQFVRCQHMRVNNRFHATQIMIAISPRDPSKETLETVRVCPSTTSPDVARSVKAELEVAWYVGLAAESITMLKSTIRLPDLKQSQKSSLFGRLIETAR